MYEVKSEMWMCSRLVKMLGGSSTGLPPPPRGCYSLHTLVCTLTSPIYPIVQKSLYQK